MEELLSKLKNNSLLDDNGNIILDKNERQTITVDQETFKTFFGDKEINYENLIGNHTFVWNGETLNKTSEELGYKDVFTKWKDLSIL